ncbi:MAG: hypothetical protein E7406_04460 [Ruminococcaceae bacterium]|nr:hypothetical protein [Oscillospiraceae bacterium]
MAKPLEKDVILVFANRKFKARVALISTVIFVLTSNISAFAAPFSYSSVEAVREKALGEYLSSGVVILADAETSETEDNKTTGKKPGVKTETVTEEVNFNIIKRLNPMLEAGAIETVQEGENGEKKVTYEVKYEKGTEVSREVISEEIVKEPVDKIVEYGNKNASAEAPVNTGVLDYKYVITCEATAYDLSPEENGGYAGQTATGVPLDKGVIAVDPRVIPLGSRVYIEAIDGSWSYGYAVAADTGGAIKGKRVDLCYRTRSECIQFGRRKCRVYILN